MLRHLSILLVAGLFAGTRGPASQCANYGSPCAGGQTIFCLNSAPPRIGTTWQIAMQVACANPAANVMLFGPCFQPGVPIRPPIACATCASCSWYSFPLAVAVSWTWPPRTLGVQIPNQPFLVGGQFCVQNVCSDRINPCVCLSNAMRVTVMR